MGANPPLSEPLVPQKTRSRAVLAERFSSPVLPRRVSEKGILRFPEI
jgi:hypothetical protein